MTLVSRSSQTGQTGPVFAERRTGVSYPTTGSERGTEGPA